MTRLPAIEGFVRRPEGASHGLWPIMTQALLIPWNNDTVIDNPDLEHVMIVPRPLWERLVEKAGPGALAAEEVSRG